MFAEFVAALAGDTLSRCDDGVVPAVLVVNGEKSTIAFELPRSPSSLSRCDDGVVTAVLVVNGEKSTIAFELPRSPPRRRGGEVVSNLRERRALPGGGLSCRDEGVSAAVPGDGLSRRDEGVPAAVPGDGLHRRDEGVSAAVPGDGLHRRDEGVSAAVPGDGVLGGKYNGGRVVPRGDSANSSRRFKNSSSLVASMYDAKLLNLEICVIRE